MSVAEVVAVGADGAPGMWAFARLHADGTTSLALAPMGTVPRAPVVAIDVPIGLLDEQRIAAVGAFVLADPAVHAWLFETHPELVFHRLAGALPPKRAAAGLVARLRAVRMRY